MNFIRDGRPFNINEAKLQFSFDDSSPAEIILTLHLWKHLDTESLELDVQPSFVRLILNDKLFQLRLLDEVKTDSCTAKRSQTTGWKEFQKRKLSDAFIFRIFRSENAKIELCASTKM